MKKLFKISFVTSVIILSLLSVSYAGFCGFLRANTATNIRIGPFLDSANGTTLENALTITRAEVRISKNGGPFASKSGVQSLIYSETGFYWFALGATDTNTPGRLMIVVNESGALMAVQTYQVIDETVYDVHYKDIE